MYLISLHFFVIRLNSFNSEFCSSILENAMRSVEREKMSSLWNKIEMMLEDRTPKLKWWWFFTQSLQLYQFDDSKNGKENNVLDSSLQNKMFSINKNLLTTIIASIYQNIIVGCMLTSMIHAINLYCNKVHRKEIMKSFMFTKRRDWTNG